MSMKRLLNRGKTIFKISPTSREGISTSPGIDEIDRGYISDPSAISEEQHVDEPQNSQPALSIYDTSGPGYTYAIDSLRHEKLSLASVPSPPSRSASTSTQSSARTLRLRAPLHTLSPPPYSIMSDYDESWSPSLSTDSTVEETRNNTTMGADEQADRGQKSKRRKNEEEEVEERAELPRMIEHLTATENEDWALVLVVCERASASEANAKEAAKALRWEFRYAEPSAQYSAAQLWAIMFRNSSTTLLEQIMCQKFLDALEDVLTSPRTPPFVKERLLEVLGAVVYACGNGIRDGRTVRRGFFELWCRFKSPSMPEEGIPFHVDDEILNPSTPRAISPEFEEAEYYDEQPLHPYNQPPSPMLERQRSVQRERSLRVHQRQRSFRSRNISSFSDEEMRHISQECNTAQSNANLLMETLSAAASQDLEMEFIQELRVKCRASQKFVVAQIPRANDDAQRSRSIESVFPPTRRPSQSGRRNIQDSPSVGSNVEELLAALVAADQILQEALGLYDDLERDAVKKQAEQVSQRFVSANRRFLDQEDAHRDVQSDVVGPFSSISRNTSLSARPLHNPAEGSVLERADSSLSSRIEYSATHQNLEQMDIGSHPMAVTGGGGQRSGRPKLSLKAAGKRKDLTEEIPRGVDFDEMTPRITLQSPQFTFSTQSPENDLNYNPWNMSSAELSSSSLPPAEPIDSLDSSISQAPHQNVQQLPDFTGMIDREGDYPVGRGGFADVWKGILRRPSGECKVAVKVLQARVYDSELKQKISKRIRREIAIWQGLDHENVLPLLGITSDFGRYMSLVSPWLENGSLMQYLDKASDSLGVGRRLQLACEIAAGLSYLHSSQVVHGDLTGANVLITDQGKACLCDFGLSTLMIAFHGTSFYTSTVGGNVRWTAPEIYRFTDNETAHSVTVQSDVYSFGCILLEILSGQVPYHYLPREVQVVMELHNGNKPNRPPDGLITDTLWNIINACWADTPTDRPTMEKVWKYIQHQINLENLPS